MFAISYLVHLLLAQLKKQNNHQSAPIESGRQSETTICYTFSARAYVHSVADTHSHTNISAVSRHFSVAWVQYSQTSSYTDDFVCLCASIFCACLRARKALGGVCVLFYVWMCVCFRYTHICQPLDLQRLRCAYESGQGVLFNVHLATIHKLYQVLQRRMTDIV